MTDKHTYTVVSSDVLEAYIASRGTLGHVLANFNDLNDAQEYALSVADDYHYGVEVVDKNTWRVMD